MIGPQENNSEFLPPRRGLLPHPRTQLLFAVLSAADLALTWWLLGHSDGQVYEANPVARWWLARHGWLGLAGFKAGVVLLVVALTAVIARSRPRSAGRLLGLGCACLALVVFYSAALCRAAARSPEERAADVTREHEEGLAEMNRETQREFRKSQAFSALRTQLCQDLAAGRCSLREAAEQVLATERGRDRRWLRVLATFYPGLPPEKRVAAWLIDQVAIEQGEPEAGRRVALRLGRELQLSYGTGRPFTYPAGPRGAAREQAGAGRRGLYPGAPAGRPDAPAL